MAPVSQPGGCLPSSPLRSTHPRKRQPANHLTPAIPPHRATPQQLPARSSAATSNRHAITTSSWHREVGRGRIGPERIANEYIPIAGDYHAEVGYRSLIQTLALRAIYCRGPLGSHLARSAQSR